MFRKKKFEQSTISGVQMGNGSIQFQGVHLNVYSFFTDGVLIDTGARSLKKSFISFFQQLKIDKVMITHFHEDHTGCAAYLQEEMRVPLYMDSKMLNICTKYPNYPLYRQLFWGRRKPFTAQPTSETFKSSNSSWHVIQTPGHSIDHLAYLNKDTGQLFSGDLYCLEKTKVILKEESVPQIIDSLQKVLSYDFKEVFCNHAGYLKEGRTSLRNKLNYLLEIQGSILKYYKEGKSPEEIKKTLFPKNYPIMFFSFGEFDSKHIIQSVIDG
ncbi:MBL fold metallo-hydrolase [Bacillus weihaiensis]|uniref:MBL fold metallo-hydrolase n=1 Tax=Bacillus weihaiensis TaxID=1547283 RepID=UPI002352F901|nr:MBL fold metallo-hydrolase [Bacillus weihaiensis]